MENNKVRVKIYGQEYTIAGDREEEAIREIAMHVDEKMRELGHSFPNNGISNLAVLTAINISEEMFAMREELAALREAKEQLERDSKHYMNMWDEAKKNFAQYKENAQKASDEKDQADARYKELEAKCNEFENSFFDLQMENMQLKSELEKYKRRDEF